MYREFWVPFGVGAGGIDSPAACVLKASLKITPLGSGVNMAGTGDVSAREWGAQDAAGSGISPGSSDTSVPELREGCGGEGRQLGIPAVMAGRPENLPPFS